MLILLFVKVICYFYLLRYYVCFLKFIWEYVGVYIIKFGIFFCIWKYIIMDMKENKILNCMIGNVELCYMYLRYDKRD